MGVRRCISPLSLLAGAVLFLAGCGSAGYDGPQRSEVSGAVTFNGAPVQQGSINLTPVGHEGRGAGGAIENGRYIIPEDLGPHLGKYRVEIFVFQPPKNAPPEGSDAGMAQVAPPKFNQESTLELEIDSEKVQKDFDLTL